jgi:very-short-patch-repair endonuclease
MRGKQDHSKDGALRRQQTDAELLIWQCLRGRRLHECKFRRQHRVGPFYLDFVCLEIGLIIELDGSQHLEPRQQHADELRTLYLERMGYRVLRFWDDEVLRDMDAVLDEIAREVQAV